MFDFGKRLKGEINKCHTFIALQTLGTAPIGTRVFVPLMIPSPSAMTSPISTRRVRIIFAIVKIMLDFYKKL